MRITTCSLWCAFLASNNVAYVCGQTPLGGAPMQMGAPTLQSNLGALSQGSLPQAPGPLPPSSFSGLGAMLGNTGQPAIGAVQTGVGSGLPLAPGAMQTGLGSGGLPAAPSAMQTGLGNGFGGILPSSSLGGTGLPASPGQGGLPSLNLLGGALSQGGGSGTPQHIQQMQAQAVQSPTIDTVCPGKQRSATNVGEDCWARIWTAGGCKAGNVPKYEDWHQTQSLEVLVGDVVQWANLPDERHKQGCYGDQGAPRNEPAPPTPTRGGMNLPSGSPLSGGLQSPLGAGLGPMGGQPMGGQPMGGPDPALPPAVEQKIMAALQSPEIANLCPGVSRSSTAVGDACWARIWRHVGCLESTTPSYGEWHTTQSFEVLVADAAQWASLPSANHRQTCYGPNAEL